MQQLYSIPSLARHVGVSRTHITSRVAEQILIPIGVIAFGRSRVAPIFGPDAPALVLANREPIKTEAK